MVLTESNYFRETHNGLEHQCIDSRRQPTYAPMRFAQPPFVIAYKAILRDPRLSLAAKAVLHIIKSYANRDGTYCFPSIERLCQNAAVSRSSMNRHLRELKKAGMIFTNQRRTKGQKASTSTFLLYDDRQAKAQWSPKRKAKKPCTAGGMRSVSPVAHGSDEKVVPFTEESAEAF